MAEGVCRDCGYGFRFDFDFFSERGLRSPTRCRECRDKRRAQRIEGSIAYWNARGRFGFIEGDDGIRYYYQQADFGDDELATTAGVRVSFLPAASKARPRASRVQMLAGTTG